MALESVFLVTRFPWAAQLSFHSFINEHFIVDSFFHPNERTSKNPKQTSENLQCNGFCSNSEHWTLKPECTVGSLFDSQFKLSAVKKGRKIGSAQNLGFSVAEETFSKSTMQRRTRQSLRLSIANDKENETQQASLPASVPRKRRSSLAIQKVSDDHESPKKVSRKTVGRSSHLPLITSEESEALASAPEATASEDEEREVEQAVGKLPEREKEYDELVKFVDNVIETGGSGSLYIRWETELVHGRPVQK